MKRASGEPTARAVEKLLTVSTACKHPMRERALVTASQYFEDSGQVLKFFTGEVVCGACGKTLVK